MAAAMGSPCDVSGATHLPAQVAARIPPGEAVASGRALTALRLEGVAPSVSHRTGALAALLRPFGAAAAVDELVSRSLWEALRDVTPFAANRAGPDEPLWCISTAPAKGAELAAAITGAADAEVYYDWAGGRLWVLVHADDAAAVPVRRAVKACGGHATLIRAPAATRAAIDVFEPPDAGLAALTKRVKDSFDPKGILNPGRMYAGT
jgi:glycolate oxidase FAD binding subunit